MHMFNHMHVKVFMHDLNIHKHNFFMNASVCKGEGVMGVWLWFWTPNIHSLMFSLSFTRHWHGGGAQVYLSIHSGIVEYNGLLLKSLALVSVKIG